MAHTAIKVRQALERAMFIYNRHPSYSQQNRGNTLYDGAYDCSSFVGVCWGVGYGGWPPATPSMVNIYTAAGFDHFGRGTPLKQGDILVYNGQHGGAGDDGHTAMVYDKAATMLIECTGSANGVVIGNSPYYFGWQDILRGSRANVPVRWTGEHPWHKRGY